MSIAFAVAILVAKADRLSLDREFQWVVDPYWRGNCSHSAGDGRRSEIRPEHVHSYNVLIWIVFDRLWFTVSHVEIRRHLSVRRFRWY